jgi:general secretion pathway protein L
MSECLVLRYPLPATPTPLAEWLRLAGDGSRIGEPGRGDLASVPSGDPGRRVVVLVPAEDVALAAPEIPGRGAARIAKLAPFALEEQLAADVDTLHFAVGATTAGNATPVAAVDRGRLTAWLAALAASHLEPAAIYPDSLAIPQNPTRIVVLIDGGRVIVRHPGAQPLVLDATPIADAFALAGLGSDAADTMAAAHVVVYGREADLDAAAGALEALRTRVETLSLQVLADGPLGLFAPGAARPPALNLLQGEFAQRQGFAGEWSRWRLAVALGALCLVLHVASLGVDLWRIRRDEAKLDQQLQAAAAEALPMNHNLARLPNLRAVVASRVQATRAAVSQGLVGALGVLAAATNAAPGTRVDSLGYRQGVTDVTLDAPDVTALDRVRETARGRGYSADLQGATQKDGRYQGRVQLKEPGK